MQQELKNIFVPFELAKLAYEKGFREWCAAGTYIHFSDKILPNAIAYNFDFDYVEGISIVMFPTHLQLILWLKNTHNIDVTMGHNGLWSVLDSQGTLIYQNDECFFEINQALDLGLKLVEPCQQ